MRFETVMPLTSTGENRRRSSRCSDLQVAFFARDENSSRPKRRAADAPASFRRFGEEHPRARGLRGSPEILATISVTSATRRFWAIRFRRRAV